MRSLIAIAALLVAGSAQACLFARDAQPKDWYDWAQALFAAEVTAVSSDEHKAVDTVSLRIVETFKGPSGASATLQIPTRMWEGCRLERPSVGARVLGALNANGDALLVPLSAAFADRMRASRGAHQDRQRSDLSPDR